MGRAAAVLLAALGLALRIVRSDSENCTEPSSMLQLARADQETDEESPIWSEGYASCYGNYQERLNSNNVACGYGSFIKGENFKKTTALCQTWAHEACGSCIKVKCTSGRTPNMACSTRPGQKVKVIDTLGGACDRSRGREGHVLDLNTNPYKKISRENGVSKCSGEVYVKYKATSCNSLVSGGIKIGLAPGQVDPWCPPFTFSNVGSAGGLYAVSVSSNGGITWNPYQRNTGNGARWDCKSFSATDGAGTYLGNKISFRLEICDIKALPFECKSSGKVRTLIDALPADWCKNGVSPCTSNSWQATKNFR